VTCSVCDHRPPSGPLAEISNAFAEAHKTLPTWQVREGVDRGDLRVVTFERTAARGVGSETRLRKQLDVRPAPNIDKGLVKILA
jgi:hypothetical protein